MSTDDGLFDVDELRMLVESLDNAFSANAEIDRIEKTEAVLEDIIASNDKRLASIIDRRMRDASEKQQQVIRLKDEIANTEIHYSGGNKSVTTSTHLTADSVKTRQQLVELQATLEALHCKKSHQAAIRDHLERRYIAQTKSYKPKQLMYQQITKSVWMGEDDTVVRSMVSSAVNDITSEIVEYRRDDDPTARADEIWNKIYETATAAADSSSPRQKL